MSSYDYVLSGDLLKSAMKSKPRDLALELPTEYDHVVQRWDGFYFYDPAYVDDGPYPTPEIAEAALKFYLENYF